MDSVEDYYYESDDDSVEEDDEGFYNDFMVEDENKAVANKMEGIDYSLLQSHFDKADNIPTGVEASLPSLINLPSNANPNSGFDAARSTSVVNSIDALLEFVSFRRFDTVDSFSDHHYARKAQSGLKGDKKWAKRISKEWSSLSTDLPETIFVRVAEDRMDLLRAAMVGPAGTPYYGGLFFFDCYFPPQYPRIAPLVYYHSGGLRINPNLYECGKVCLSLLGTWSGEERENWVAGESTMLQVLVSIQALILNEKPFFNEPGFEERHMGKQGVNMSNKYNENVFVYSLRTMVYSLKNPPNHFSDLVTWHFRRRGRDILVACKAYGDKASREAVDKKFKIFEEEEESKGKGKEKEKESYKGSVSFRTDVKGIMKLLVVCFSRVGTRDIDEFRLYDPGTDLTIRHTNNT